MSKWDVYKNMSNQDRKNYGKDFPIDERMITKPNENSEVHCFEGMWAEYFKNESNEDIFFHNSDGMWTEIVYNEKGEPIKKIVQHWDRLIEPKEEIYPISDNLSSTVLK